MTGRFLEPALGTTARLHENRIFLAVEDGRSIPLARTRIEDPREAARLTSRVLEQHLELVFRNGDR